VTGWGLNGESNRQDNIAMKAIAADSKQVALSALKDSGSMRTIAVITMIFLPATFTAVRYNLKLIHIVSILTIA
jgi:hypothetical protein